MHSERRRGRSRTRVLYWFRTPPGVKVGRTALDDEALRRIEQQNPDLEFDWPRILKGGGVPSTEPRPPMDTRRPDKGAQRSGVRPQSRGAGPRPGNWGQTPDERRAVPAEQGNPVQPSPPPDEWGQTPVDVSGAATNEWGQTPVEGPAGEANERGLTPVEQPSIDALPVEGTAAHAKLGQDGVQRLRQRYADVRARIVERAPDPTRRDELLTTAERLNPDAWNTADEVASALEQYESVLAALRDVVGRKRRRRKRGGRRVDNGSSAQGASAPPDARPEGTEPDDDAEDDEPEEPGSGD